MSLRVIEPTSSLQDRVLASAWDERPEINQAGLQGRLPVRGPQPRFRTGYARRLVTAGHFGRGFNSRRLHHLLHCPVRTHRSQIGACTRCRCAAEMSDPAASAGLFSAIGRCGPESPPDAPGLVCLITEACPVADFREAAGAGADQVHRPLPPHRSNQARRCRPDQRIESPVRAIPPRLLLIGRRRCGRCHFAVAHCGNQASAQRKYVWRRAGWPRSDLPRGEESVAWPGPNRSLCLQWIDRRYGAAVRKGCRFPRRPAATGDLRPGDPSG